MIGSERNHNWPPFRLTFVEPRGKQNKYGRIQGFCPYHAKNDKTGCTLSIGLKSDTDYDRCRLYIMAWLLDAPTFKRKDSHHKHKDHISVPPEEMMQIKVRLLPPPPSKDELFSDEFQDALGLSGESDEDKAEEEVSEEEAPGDEPAAEEPESAEEVPAEVLAAVEPAPAEPPPEARAAPATAASSSSSSRSSSSGSSSSSSD